MCMVGECGSMRALVACIFANRYKSHLLLFAYVPTEEVKGSVCVRHQLQLPHNRLAQKYGIMLVILCSILDACWCMYVCVRLSNTIDVRGCACMAYQLTHITQTLIFPHVCVALACGAVRASIFSYLIITVIYLSVAVVSVTLQRYFSIIIAYFCACFCGYYVMAFI